MVLNSNSTHITWKSNSSFSSVLQIVDVLTKFSDHYDKKLNFDTLANVLKLSPTQVDEVIAIILQFQELFKTIFRDFHLKKKIENNKIYLVAEKTFKIQQIPTKIIMTQNHVKLLNDLIYLFKFIKRGKGFDIKTNNTELLQKIKTLCDYYPYLFKKENGRLYPTEFGLKLGELFLSYKKTNKSIKCFEFEDYIIRMIEDE